MTFGWGIPHLVSLPHRMQKINLEFPGLGLIMSVFFLKLVSKSFVFLLVLESLSTLITIQVHFRMGSGLLMKASDRSLISEIPFESVLPHQKWPEASGWMSAVTSLENTEQLQSSNAAVIRAEGPCSPLENRMSFLTVLSRFTEQAKPGFLRIPLRASLLLSGSRRCPL